MQSLQCSGSLLCRPVLNLNANAFPGSDCGSQNARQKRAVDLQQEMMTISKIIFSSSELIEDTPARNMLYTEYLFFFYVTFRIKFFR